MNFRSHHIIRYSAEIFLSTSFTASAATYTQILIIIPDQIRRIPMYLLTEWEQQSQKCSIYIYFSKEYIC